ncbi:MAG: glycosyltransferase family 39 protein [Chloroflexi bacterium]|nr:glycosyltransferase family 39 protein [Chloroflexota bacterium]
MTNRHNVMQIPTKQYQGPSRWGWAFLLLVLVTAVFLRFWQVGAAPPGLYHDEAYNGLDAARVLVEGPSLYFAANNGREPAYIWLTALAVAAVGQTALAVRLAAAVVGSLTLIPVYLLAKSWFDVRVGLFAAWLWAITLWPVHLSRIGLRAILLVPLLALTFWLGTLAFRRQKSWLWLLAGAAYGLSFYTYLAARFTPLLLALLLLFLLWRGVDKRLWPGVVWFGLATAVVLLPLALFFWQNPDLLLGRTGQVSILSPAINGGDVWGTLWRQTGAALGMFLWRGDAILRHNPAGRPVFDLFMAAPFFDRPGLVCVALATDGGGGAAALAGGDALAHYFGGRCPSFFAGGGRFAGRPAAACSRFGLALVVGTAGYLAAPSIGGGAAGRQFAADGARLC